MPQQYLSKVMRKLVLARLVHGQRGRGGGFMLEKPARQIRIAILPLSMLLVAAYVAMPRVRNRWFLTI